MKSIDLDNLYAGIAVVLIVTIVAAFAWWWNPGEEINYRIERSKPEPRFVRV